MTSLLSSPTGRLATAWPVRWRYHFTDFRTGRLLSTLPLSGVSLSDVLSGAADGTATLSLGPAVIDRDPFAATTPRRSCLWAERQELNPYTGAVVLSTVPWAGIVMARNRSHAARSMKLGLVTWAAYFQRRLVRTRTYRARMPGSDKFTIFRNIVADAVDQPTNGPFGDSPHLADLAASVIHVAAPGSGVRADRTYLASDLKPALEAMVELGNSGEGFDWRLVPYMAVPGDLTSFRLRLDLGYPRLGRVGVAELRWSTDPADRRQRWGYVSDLSVAEDGSGVNNEVTAVGAGSGPDQIRQTATAAQTTRDELADGYPRYEGALTSSSSDDKTIDTVYGKALGGLLAGFASELRISGIQVRGDLAPTLSAYSLGDDLTVKVGDTTTGVVETFTGQLVGRTVKPAEAGGTEQVSLDVQGTRVGAEVSATARARATRYKKVGVDDGRYVRRT